MKLSRRIWVSSEPPQSVDPIPDGDLRIMLTENHLSWTFTHNIVYDIFQETNHSVFKSDATNASVSLLVTVFIIIHIILHSYSEYNKSHFQNDKKLNKITVVYSNKPHKNNTILMHVEKSTVYLFDLRALIPSASSTIFIIPTIATAERSITTS